MKARATSGASLLRRIKPLRELGGTLVSTHPETITHRLRRVVVD